MSGLDELLRKIERLERRMSDLERTVEEVGKFHNDVLKEKAQQILKGDPAKRLDSLSKDVAALANTVTGLLRAGGHTIQAEPNMGPERIYPRAPGPKRT